MNGTRVVQIRIAGPDDYDTLLPLFLDLRRYSRKRHPPQRDDFERVLCASRGYLREILARDNDAVTFLAVTADGTAAGYLVAVVHQPNPLTSSGTVRTGAIDELYVDDGLRGTGAGGALMSAAEEWFLRRDAERIEVGAYAWNDEAISFYERHGFTPVSVILARSLGTES